MRFMLFVYSDASPDELAAGPDLEMVRAMNKFNEELSRAGVLLALDGLHPAQFATRVTHTGEGRPTVTDEGTVTDGPFTEAKEMVGGYWIIQARSKEEAVEWASRAPIGPGTIEVRQIAEGSDYAPEIEEAAKLSTEPPEQTVAE
jgi:hypothetical protein